MIGFQDNKLPLPLKLILCIFPLTSAKTTQANTPEEGNDLISVARSFESEVPSGKTDATP